MNFNKPSNVWCRIRFIFLVLPILLSASINAQTTGFKQTFTDAEYYFLMQDYKEALPLYQKLYQLDSTNSNINFRLGQCYLNIPGLKDKSIPYLEQSVNNINPKYNEGSYKETAAPPIALFYLGEAYMVNHMLDKALNSFKEFKGRLDVKDIYNLDYVNQQINACEIAKKFIENPIKISIEKISPFADKSKNCNYPVFSGDRNTMAFTVEEKFYSGIYVCKKVNGEWGTPINITLDLGIEGEIYSTSLNYDGTKLLLFHNEISSGNIYSSDFVNGKWQHATKLDNTINSKDWETFASISPNGKKLFFTSNRKGGKGGLDIYFSELQPNGSWGLPQNLGDAVNTPYNEESPIFSDNCNSLYFASQGHNSMGGFDIFCSKLLDDNTWATPINLGYPINTPDDEFYYFPIDSTTGIMPLVSKELVTDYEIYKVKVDKTPPIQNIELAGKINLDDNGDFQSDSITISIKNASNNEIIATAIPSSNGSFSSTLNPGTYVAEAHAKYYSMNPVNIFIPKQYNQKSFPLELTLFAKTNPQDDIVRIKNILFDFDSYALTRDAMFELEKAFSIMEANPSFYIEVSGHTDSKGSPAYNKKLSAKRANAVVEYLVGKGIDEKRFIVKGMGSSINVAANTNPDGSDNPAGRSLNRRASIKILNTDKKVVAENVDSPEHIKPQNQTYTILLAKPGDKISGEAVKQVEKELDLNSKKTPVGIYYYLTIGSFATKSQAIATLNKIVEFDLPEATLIGEQEFEKTVKSERQKLTSTSTIFTILLMTSETPVDRKTFRGLSATEEKGNDGFYRYYFGAFNTREQAQAQLEKINALGFPNAMLVKLENK